MRKRYSQILHLSNYNLEILHLAAAGRAAPPGPETKITRVNNRGGARAESLLNPPKMPCLNPPGIHELLMNPLNPS